MTFTQYVGADQNVAVFRWLQVSIPVGRLEDEYLPSKMSLRFKKDHTLHLEIWHLTQFSLHLLSAGKSSSLGSWRLRAGLSFVRELSWLTNAVQVMSGRSYPLVIPQIGIQMETFCVLSLSTLSPDWKCGCPSFNSFLFNSKCHWVSLYLATGYHNRERREPSNSVPHYSYIFALCLFLLLT